MKKRFGIYPLLLLIMVTTSAQNPDSLREVIKAMSFGVPVLSPVPSSVNEVKTATISLNGTWKFNPANKDQNMAKNIEVPGEWEMQGFKVAKGNSGTYWKTFIIPMDWEGNRVKIRFDGVSSHGLIKVNGKIIGSHEGSFVAFEFDITDAVKPGENVLEVEVQCETISDILACTSQYAAHPVAGILRNVTLYVLPEISISDFSWNVEFDSTYSDATLNFNSKVEFRTKKKPKVQLKFDIQDIRGQPINLNMNTFDFPVSRTISEVHGSISVPSPKKWDPEHPNLYVLTYSLVADGKILQTNRQKIGFRQIELRGNRFFVNNQPVKLRGVNRHEVHPLRGRSLTPELCHRDVELFRAGNCNYIRTSHYPPSEDFLQACDELGMFVESEASLCWIEHHASPIWKTWNYLDTQYLPYMMRANHENVLSGRQHTCIILWSLGNESRWSPLWERVNAEVRKLDPTRPTVFHDQCWGSFNNAASCADIANYHYPRFNGPRECKQEKIRPTLFGEYLAVQCYARREIETDPSVRSDIWANTLKQMVDSVYRNPSCMGGAIWAAIDDIFHLSEDKICGYGPWGLIDGWRREKPEYAGMKKSYSPVIITNLYTANAVNGKIKLDVENRYNFSNLNEVKIIARTGSHTFPLHADIAPMSKGSIIIDITSFNPEDKLVITFSDPRGFVCQEEVIQIGHTATPIVSNVKVKLELIQDDNRHIIKSGKTTFIISKATGALECITSGGDKVISAGGALMMVPFNNDDGGAPHVAFNNYTQDIQPLEYKPSEKFKIKSIVPMQKADSTLYIKLSGELENLLEGSQEYIFNTDGTVTVSYDYITLTDFTKNNLLRQFGLLFTLPKSFDRLSWERKGLWSIYPENDINRLKGSAKALPRDLKYVEAPLEVPIGEWKDNANKLGTNDFKSTKSNIIWASLKNDNKTEVIVKTDGSQSIRSWIDGEKTWFLIAGLNGPGSCGYFIGPRPELKKGDHLNGKFLLGIQEN
jgi:beta-galactosidase